MPEKNRFPAVLQPVNSNGGPIAPTLDTYFDRKWGSDQWVNNGFGILRPIEPELYSIMPMNSGKDYKARKVEVTQPLMATPVSGNQGGDFVVQSVALRGRDGGATAELGGEAAYALRASEGGGSDPYVLAFSCKDYGADAVEDIAPTMRAMGHSATWENGGGQLAVVQPEMAVRRLMPIECHRLQGFFDNWCAVPTGPKGDKIAADGPQYKQLGNSWAVRHARWVGYRIAMWLMANQTEPRIEMEFDENLLLWAMVDG